MLVLSRKRGESIVIGGQVRIVVERLSPKSVRLSIDAPRHIEVDREEVWRRKQSAATPPLLECDPQ